MYIYHIVLYTLPAESMWYTYMVYYSYEVHYIYIYIGGELYYMYRDSFIKMLRYG